MEKENIFIYLLLDIQFPGVTVPQKTNLYELYHWLQKIRSLEENEEGQGINSWAWCNCIETSFI